MHMTNAALIDIFSKYADNTVMTEFVSADGSIDLKFSINSPIEPPNCCEHILSLLFVLLENNPETPIGKIYMANQIEILRDTVSRLAQVIDSFSNIKLSVHIAKHDEKNPDTEVFQHTEFKITRTKSKS